MLLLRDTVSNAKANQTRDKQDTVPSNYSNRFKNFLKFLYTKTSTFALITQFIYRDKFIKCMNFPSCVNSLQRYKNHLLVKSC